MTNEQKTRRILDLVYNRGRRVSSRKQSQIGTEINGYRRWIFAEAGSVNIDVALRAAQQISNHKGRWDDSLRQPCKTIAFFLVSIGKQASSFQEIWEDKAEAVGF